MKTALNIMGLVRKMPIEQVLDYVKQSGFDFVEIPLDKMMSSNYIYGPNFLGDDYIEQAKQLREMIDKAGLKVVQVYAPTPDTRPQKNFDTEGILLVMRGIEIAAVLGASVITVLPMTHIEYYGNTQQVLDMNVEYFTKLAPLAKKNGIKIALKNMVKFSFRHRAIYYHACGTADEFVNYLDTLNKIHGDLFVACVDVGNTNLATVDFGDMLNKLGSRVAIVHISDNDYRKNNQSIPGNGSINFEKVSAALKENNYSGYYTMFCESTLPAQLMPSVLQHMYDVACYYANLAQ